MEWWEIRQHSWVWFLINVHTPNVCSGYIFISRKYGVLSHRIENRPCYKRDELLSVKYSPGSDERLIHLVVNYAYTFLWRYFVKVFSSHPSLASAVRSINFADMNLGMLPTRESCLTVGIVLRISMILNASGSIPAKKETSYFQQELVTRKNAIKPRISGAFP